MQNVAISKTARWFTSFHSTVALNSSTGRYYFFNETCTAVWLDVISGYSCSAMETRFRDRYRLSAATAHQDVAKVLALFLKSGLVEPLQNHPAVDAHD